MKQLFLLPILFALFMFTSCSKDDEVEPIVETALDKELKGEWTRYEMVAVYIDGQDQVAHTDTSHVEVIHTFSKPNMKIIQSGNETTVNYALPDSSGTKYIVITDSEMRQDVFEIKKLTETEMVWEKVLRYASYQSGDSTITSRRGIFTHYFRKN